MSEEETKKQQLEVNDRPWLDIRLAKEGMDFLWYIIDHTMLQQRDNQIGNISKSIFIQDKDNWFYDNALKEYSELLYYKEWNNYYNVKIAKIIPPPVFTLEKIWVNYQKQHEFNPPHDHGGIFAFAVFMKIPTHWKEQHTLPWLKNTSFPRASDFQFLIGQGSKVETINILLGPKDEGRMLLFPSWLSHQVFPFYETEKERITISGNIEIVR
jgi:hypothetical protein